MPAQPATTPAIDPPTAYAANRRALWAATAAIISLQRDALFVIREGGNIRPFTAAEAPYRAEQDRLSAEGRELAAAIGPRVAVRLDNEAHAEVMPEWAAAKAAGARFTQPRLVKDARRSRPSRMVGGAL